MGRYGILKEPVTSANLSYKVSYNRVTGSGGNIKTTPLVEAAGIEPASESLLQRRLHAYPGCGREPAPGGAFPSFGPAPHQPGESRLGTYP